MRLTELENYASDALGIPVRIAACRSDRNADDLNAAESAQLARFETEARRRDWRRGRLALKSVLRLLNRSDDTSDIHLPAPQLSLTHADGAAIALGTPEPEAQVGIDAEVPRPVNQRMALWFLNEPELDWLAKRNASVRAHDIVRLWTVKEAVFKSHPSNHGLVMTDFTIADPGSAVSDVHDADGRQFRCASFPEDLGIVSIAIQGESHED